MSDPSALRYLEPAPTIPEEGSRRRKEADFRQRLAVGPPPYVGGYGSGTSSVYWPV